MVKRAIIDIGSNSVQLLVAESEENHFRPCLHLLRTVRLGATLANSQLDPRRIDDLLDVLSEYRRLLQEQAVEQLRLIATSAVRDARNRDLLLGAVKAGFGWTVNVLTGDQEAELSFKGAAGPYLDANPGKLAMIDIGGGSTELVTYKRGKLETDSFNIGAVRALHQGLADNQIAWQVIMSFYPERDRGPWDLVLGVGGTITTTAALLLELPQFTRAAVEGYILTPQALEGLLARLKPLSIGQRCNFSPLLAERGEIIWQGLQILKALFSSLQLPQLTVCAGGLLDGCLLAWEQLEA